MTGTLAIIGASTGQRPVYQKARELGFRTLGFAWEEGAVCKELADRFFPISITDTDSIVEICRKEGVSGVVSNGSDLTAEAVSAVSSRLGLPGVPHEAFSAIKDKYAVRALTSDIEGLHSPWFFKYDGQDPLSFPCIVKPCVGAAKKGVCYAETPDAFHAALRFTLDCSDGDVIVEEYVRGREISVEAISFQGKHEIVQMTDKETSGPPHFVEIAHHQPSTVPEEEGTRIKGIVRRILTRIHYDNGASHIELKLTGDGRIFLIEVNPRGGGDEIANRLVPLSTGFDYISAMIMVAVGRYGHLPVKTIACSGIYYLCSQTEHLLPFFAGANGKPWLVSKVIQDLHLSSATTNYDRNGYLIYSSDHKVLPTE